METFELLVRPQSYQLHCPAESEDLQFSTLLAAFTYAQMSMSDESAEMVVKDRFGRNEHVPLYRMTE